uniref:Uncharacterized protein n=1 Tax=Solanum lycopersicum TaxID=4081 RepID=A0A3Q7IH01_SOLLC
MQTIVFDDTIQVSVPVLNIQDDDHVCMHDHTDSTTRYSIDHTSDEPNMNPFSVVQEPTISSTIEKRQSTRTSRPPFSQKDFVTSTKSGSNLSQFMNAPKRSHMDVVVRVVRYNKQNPGSGIFLVAQSSDSLQAYCDADWGSCLDTRKSITGYMVKFEDSLLSLKSKKQSTVSRSSAEAEYRSMVFTIAEVT